MTGSRRPRTDRGAVIPIVALLLVTLVTMTAFAVDLGRQRSDRRSMQAAADVIALDMARLADGRQISFITVGDLDHPGGAEAAITASASRNGVDRSQVSFDWGIVDPVSGAYTSLNFDPAGVPNAARVVATDTTEYHFQPGSGDVVRSAVARHSPTAQAGFQVGSFGVDVDSGQSALLEAILSPVLGDPVRLTAVGYQGLAGASVNLLELGTEIGLLTPDELLDTDVSLSDVMLASADILRRNGNDLAAGILDDSITAETDDLLIRFAEIVSVEDGSETSGLDTDIDVLGMIQVAAMTSTCEANPSGFDDCTGLAIPNLQTPLPLLPASTAGVIKVIQGPRYHYGPEGSGVETGQVQVAFNATFGSQAVGECVPDLSNLGCVLNDLNIAALDATVRVDALVTLFGGLNTVDDIRCENPSAKELVVGSTTNAYDIDLTVTVKFGSGALLGGPLSELVGDVQFMAETSPASAPDSVTFTVPPDVLGEKMRTTGTGPAGLSGLTLTPTSGSELLGAVGDLTTSVTSPILTSLVNPALALLDENLLGPLTRALGINITGSDIIAEQIDCNSGVVQLVG